MKKPRVSIPGNFDSLDARVVAVSDATFAIASGSGPDKVDTITLSFEQSVLKTARDLARSKNDGALASHQAAEVLNGERDVAVSEMVASMRRMRDLGFTEFSDDYNRLSEWGFEVIQSPASPPPPPPE